MEIVSKKLIEEDVEDIYRKCEHLYLVGDDQFVGQIAKDLGFPKFIDQRRIWCEHLDTIKMVYPTEKKGFYEISDMPIAANISFFKNVVKDEIVAISHQMSTVSHYDVYRRGVLKLLPKINEYPIRNLTDDSSSEYGFRKWCEDTYQNLKENNML